MSKPNFELLVDTDKETGKILAAYFRVRQGQVADTEELADGKAHADYDSEGSLLGIEVLAPCSIAVFDNIARKEEEPVRQFFRNSVPRSLVVA